MRPISPISFLLFSMLAIALFSAVTATPTSSFAQSRIVALVNDEPVTSYEVDQRFKLLKLTTRNPSRQKAIDELIEEKLKLQEAKRRGVNPSPQDVDSAFAQIAGRTKMSPTQLSQALGQQGVSPATLKNRLKAEIAWSTVVRLRFRRTVRVQESDVVASLRDRTPEQNQVREYSLKQVIFIVPQGASDSAVTSAKQRAEAFRPTIAGCDAVNIQAQGMRDVVVKNVGRRDETQIPKALQDKLNSVVVSQGTEPGRIAEGWEILVVCDVRTVASDAVAREEVRSEMMDKEGQLLARRYIRDLRQDAVIEMR